MSAKAESAPHAPHVVGNVFVEQYYNLLYEAPQKVHNFYQESSVLSRPGLDGAMVAVTTKKDINEQILSFDYRSTKVQILTVDSQESYKNGVIVLVTALLIGENNLKRKFTQSFFLVPQQQSKDRCYFVLNDVLRYVDEAESGVPTINDVNESVVVDPLTTNNDTDNDKESFHPVNNGNIGLSQRIIDTHLVSEVAHFKTLKDNTKISNAPVELASPTNVGDVPKKSYAAILAEKALALHSKVSVAKRLEQPHSTKTSVEQPPSTKTSVEKPQEIAKHVEQSGASARSVETAIVGNNLSDKYNVKGRSIFVANLPMDAMDVQLHEAFSKFGIIVTDGVQVRSQKQKGNCFGFVTFKSASSVQSVFEAYRTSPIIIGGRKVSIEEKQGNSDGSRRFASNRGSYRRDNFRGQGNFNGGHNDEKVFQNGGGNVGRQN